jgi:hypothetical protein
VVFGGFNTFAASDSLAVLPVYISGPKAKVGQLEFEFMIRVLVLVPVLCIDLSTLSPEMKVTLRSVAMILVTLMYVIASWQSFYVLVKRWILCQLPPGAKIGVVANTSCFFLFGFISNRMLFPLTVILAPMAIEHSGGIRGRLGHCTVQHEPDSRGVLGFPTKQPWVHR